MKKFRRKNEVYIWTWTGDKTIIDELNEVIKTYEGDIIMKVGLTDDEKILCLSNTRYGGTGTQYIRFGEYVVFDPYDEDMPLCTTNDHLIEENYIEL